MWQAIENINFRPVGKVLATGEKKEDVINFWVAGRVSITYTSYFEIKRLKPESLRKRRLTRLKNKLIKNTPLFFDELFARESAKIA
ncbi:hypothetical protein [Methylotenera sp.]|uniref:hypothetical protein n=1 Tax=Methylotenera sp. TaxID=2051956 RepID=UPI002488CF4D|nr:hypothetical protein [Methylotenera sp.]MDI1299777.1 hypothetical protein [Methylotenera sp.]